MKTRFRKILSIAVALVMLMSLCLSAPLTVSAATVSVTVNNSGNIYTVDANVGEELAAPAERTNGMHFLGWYSDPACTVEYGAVQENETRKAYAKYPSTFIGFEGKDNYASGVDYRPKTNGAAGVVVDPTNENNKVLKLQAQNLWSNIIMPQYDDNDSGKYMLQSNHSYTFTFKFMIPGGSSVDKVCIRMNQGDMPEGGAGRTFFGDTYYKQSEITPLTWYTFSVTRNVGDASGKTSPQLVANWVGGTNNATDYVYFDDVVITDNDSGIEIEVDNTFTSFEGCTVKYEGGFNSSSSATVSNEQAKSGMSSLKIAPGGANTYRSYAYNSKNSVLKLDSYTRYTISYWYMATALGGTYTNIYTTLNGNGNVWDKNIQLNKTEIHGSALNEWHKAEFEVITGDCSSQAYLTFGLQTAAAGTVVYIDDVTVTAGEYIGMHDYYCDFNADFSHYGEPGVTHPWPYYSSNVNFNTDNGILYFPTTHPTAPTTSGSTYVQHFAPYDGNSYYQFEANTSYRVVIRYKQTCANNNNTGYFSIGSKANIPASEGIKSLAINHITGSTDWKEYTLDFTTESIGNQKYLTLTFGSQDGSLVEYEVDYIKVTKGPFINNNGEIYKNNTEVGAEIATPNFDANKYNFIGWYSNPECTKPFGTVRENETRTAYARYNKTIINFSEAEFTQKSTYRDDGEKYGGYESGIVLDPTDATNKVFKLHSPAIWSNFVVPVYDAKNASYYPIMAGVEYTVSFDYMLPEGVTASKLQLRILGGTGSTGGSRDPYDTETLRSYNVSEIEAGKWYTYSITFTGRDSVANNPYLLIGYMLDGGSAKADSASGIANYVYFDNVTVYNNAQFETVTINNRGTVSTVEMVVGTELPSINSTLDEQVFLGWYSDPECTVPFGAIQKDEQRTAYAKYDTVKVTFGNEHKQLNAGETFTVPCYDGVENAFNLEANKTYAMRFIVKPLKDSAAGTISVLGNEFKFNAYTAENANAWTPASITFTTTEAIALQMAVASGNVLIDDIIIYELDYVPETSVTKGNGTVSVTKPIAQNNMQTGTVTVAPADGEQLKAGGIIMTYDLYATAFSEPVTTRVFLKGDDAGKVFTYYAPAAAKNLAVFVEFVNNGADNLETIAVSIRENNGKNTSGIRFRTRVANNANIKNVGFIAAPIGLMEDAGVEVLTLENAADCYAYVVEANGVFYEQTAAYTDYQVILANIDGMLDEAIQVVAYVEYTDGTVAYATAVSMSYNDVVARTNRVVRGITSYYSDEYEDTRDKLLKTQNDGTFSFLSLTDIHIDYVKEVADGEYWYTTPVGEKLPDRYNIQREIAMVIEMANTTDVDCIILGGDLVHGTYGHNSALGELNYLAQVFQKAKVPVISARGNHDNNDYHGKPCALQHIITNEEWTTTLTTPLAKGVETVHDEDDPYSTYYYMDFPEKKTRVITLDAWNYPIITTDGVHSVYSAENGWDMYGDDAQVEWFAKVALDAELQGWNYVLSTHAPIAGNSYSGSSSNTNLIREIITAFNKKTSVNVYGTTMDYSNYDGQMPLNVSGHTHIHSWRLLGDTMAAVNTSSGRLAYYPNESLNNSATHTDYHPVRWEGTYSEAFFDAVVYDKAINTIQRFNFGNCPDDKFVFTENGIEVTVTPHDGPLG